MTISWTHHKAKLFVMFSSSILLGGVFVILFNVSTSLSRDEAEERVRLFLSREVTQRYMAALKDKRVSKSDVDIGRQLKEELSQINTFEFMSVDVGRLIPDILLRPHRPTHIVRVVLRNQHQQFPPRYFWLPWADIDSETSQLAWLFSI